MESKAKLTRTAGQRTLIMVFIVGIICMVSLLLVTLLSSSTIFNAEENLRFVSAIDNWDNSAVSSRGGLTK